MRLGRRELEQGAVLACERMNRRRNTGRSRYFRFVWGLFFVHRLLPFLGSSNGIESSFAECSSLLIAMCFSKLQ
jgi:hypothetical protein